MKKLTYEYVYNYFKQFNYTLLSDVYESSHQLLEVKCPEGHTYKVKFNNFKSGKRCPECFLNSQKFSYEYVKSYIEKFKYKLLSQEYTNTTKELELKCPNGHYIKMTFSNFRRGARCVYCQGLKLTYEFVKENIESFGYQLLSTEYIGSGYKLDMICTEGHLCSISWDNFKQGNRCSICSFALSKEKEIQTRIKNNGSLGDYLFEISNGNIEMYWDYKKNNYLDPYKVSKGSNQYILIKCQEKDYHESYNVICYSFTNGTRCPYCNSFASGKVHIKDSFAQWGIDNLGEDFLKKYWDYEKNVLNPWTISTSNNRNIYIKCQETNYHGTYKTSCTNFKKGMRCSYCSHRKIHPLDSLGALYPQVIDLWSDKNKKSPYEYAPQSSKKVFWKCDLGQHEDYERAIYASLVCEFRCPFCNISKGERTILKYLQKRNIIFIQQKQYNNLLGVGNGLLSYDFYLPDYNLLIEYQGEFHDGNTRKQTKKDIERQKEHDRRKREHANKNNIKLLEIWYWDFDKIEEILERELAI